MTLPLSAATTASSDSSFPKEAAEAASLASILMAHEAIAEANQTKQDTLDQLKDKKIELLEHENENLIGKIDLLKTEIMDAAIKADVENKRLIFEKSQVAALEAKIRLLEARLDPLEKKAAVLDEVVHWVDLQKANPSPTREEVISWYPPSTYPNPSVRQNYLAEYDRQSVSDIPYADNYRFIIEQTERPEARLPAPPRSSTL